MNEFVYEKIKYVYPVACAVKTRKDKDFLIVTNSQLDFLFLNDIASQIYHMCNGKTSIEMIINKIYEIYDVGLEELKEDTVSLLRDLQWRHLLKFKRYVKADMDHL